MVSTISVPLVWMPNANKSQETQRDSKKDAIDMFHTTESGCKQGQDIVCAVCVCGGGGVKEAGWTSFINHKPTVTCTCQHSGITAMLASLLAAVILIHLL